MSEQVLTFTCVNCPIGCLLEVKLDENGAVADISGNSCNRGISYAEQEAVDPKRNISAVCMVAGCLEPLSVKTAEPVSKEKIFEVMKVVSGLELQAPIAAGEVLVENVADTGVNIVATKSIS